MLYFFVWTDGANAFDDAAIKAQCDRKWTTNFEMVVYCRSQQRAAAKAVDELARKAEADELVNLILDACREKWGANYEMVKYCFDQQRAAHVKLNQNDSSLTDVPDAVSAAIRTQCDRKWGTNFEMVRYCVEQQTDAWRSLQAE